MPGMIHITSPSHLKELFDNVDLPKYSVLRIGPFDQAQLEPAFEVFAEVLWRYEDYALIVDESHMLQSKNRINPALDRFLRRSPASVHVIQTAHRMMELNGLSRYLCDDLRLFRNEQPRELDLIEEQFGIPPEEIRNLGDRQHVHWYRDDVGNPQHFIQYDTNCWYIDLRNPNRRRVEPEPPNDPRSNASGGE